ncbi:DUF294 nucleotidyltransferase-like domain-containing protein [Gracilibacillus timonensis]|uniref:DUF294 nucleotidyltransferase-like domain-containing protein n=1 Tax=Gracilibacillus timonensis TaxID=1816696 RepID=UPI000824CFBD|nr:DUF294 nucleotidyltransferase-like domain-containing protein [Gracilibacillus timonensis]
MKKWEEMMTWRMENMPYAKTFADLNRMHEQLMTMVVEQAIAWMNEKEGAPPVPFAFFVMGSAGRQEQAIWSDQDHGIVFDGEQKEQAYFQSLGEKIVKGMSAVGYQECDGKVMASESMWTKSVQSWQQQVLDWLTEESWQSLRHASTFFDSRVLTGEKLLLEEVKQTFFSYVTQHPQVMLRLKDNVDFTPKGLGLFSQLLPKQSGERTGQINIKITTMFPYINALRLLAIWNHRLEVPTMERLSAMESTYPFMKEYQPVLESLFSFKWKLTRDAATYEDVHYVSVDQLTKQEKQDWKQYIRKGTSLFEQTKKQIEKECSQ